jgi:hypothetical protein
MPIAEDELADAYTELRRLGYDETTFTFRHAPYKHLGAGVAPIVADVIVTNTANGSEKTYDAGHGSSWPAEFSDDLRAGVFGPPTR